jgi:flagellar motor switch protein FliG
MITWSLLAWALVLQTGSEAQENNVVKEEAYALENLYQQKAQQTLENLLNPDDYTVVVSASIRNDEAKLKEYQEMMDRKFLPGLVINDPAGFSDEHNLLHGLKQKVEIQVVLTDKVPADRDALVKDLLRSKLKLSEEMGDVITVSRAVHRAPASEIISARKIPELTGKMIGFLIVLAGIVAAAMALWYHRRREEKRTQESILNANFTEKEKIRQAIEEEGRTTEEQAKVGKTPEEIEMEARLLREKVQNESNNLVKLAEEHLTIVMNAIEEYVAAGNVSQMTLIFERIGWEDSRRLFRNLSSKIWNKVAANLRDREEDPTDQEAYDALHEFNRFALSHVLEKAGNNMDNPFAFIFKLSHSNRIDLLSGESAYHIGLISIYCSGAQMGQLMEGLPQEKRDDIFFNISKIRNLPEAEVNESVRKLVTRLEAIKKAPSIHIDGLGIAARFIRSLDPLKEEELYRSIREKHPEQSEQLRRAQVMFDDVPYYPQEQIRKIVGGLDAQEVVSALAGYPSEFVEAFLAMMPTKKALMIQNDLFHMSEAPPQYQGAVARRNITVKIEEEFEKTRFDIAAYWDSFSQNRVEQEPTQLIEEGGSSSDDQGLHLVSSEEQAEQPEQSESKESAEEQDEQQDQDQEQDQDKKESA